MKRFHSDGPATDDVLVSASDIARLLGVVPSAVTNWTNRQVGFPIAATVVSQGRMPLWWLSDVQAWLAGRKLGPTAGRRNRSYTERMAEKGG